MPEVIIVYWRDIPAQVIVGSGRRASKQPMPERFEVAIDRCAMRAGACDSDAYLGEWRKGEPYLVEGEAEDVASGEAERLEAEFSPEAIKALIDNEGWAEPKT
jgi:Virulence factor